MHKQLGKGEDQPFCTQTHSSVSAVVLGSSHRFLSVFGLFLYRPLTSQGAQLSGTHTRYLVPLRCSVASCLGHSLRGNAGFDRFLVLQQQYGLCPQSLSCFVSQADSSLLSLFRCTQWLRRLLEKVFDHFLFYRCIRSDVFCSGAAQQEQQCGRAGQRLLELAGASAGCLLEMAQADAVLLFLSPCSLPPILVLDLARIRARADPFWCAQASSKPFAVSLSS